MKELRFKNEQFQIFPVFNKWGNPFVHVMHWDKDFHNWCTVENVHVEETETIKEVFDKTVAKYTQP